MAKIDFLNRKQKEELLRNIDISKDAKLIKIERKIYLYTGGLNAKQILNLSRVARIENVGLFLLELP